MRTQILALSTILVLALGACTTTPTPAPTAVELPTSTLAPAATATAIPAEPTATVQPDAQLPVTSSGMVNLVLVPEESFAQYSVEETFLSENNRLATAVGTTSQLSGSLQFDPATPSQIEFGEFTVDISTLATDSSRRDNAIRTRWLESSAFPLAKFTVTSLSGFPEAPQEGQPLSFQMTGDLAIRETTLPATWDVTATYQDGKLTGQATTFIMMADWGVTPPNIAGVLIVKDGVTLTLNFTFVQQ